MPYFYTANITPPHLQMINPKLKLSTSEQDTLLFQEPYVSIYYNKVEKWLYVYWQGERTIETLKNGAEQMIRLAKETKAHKIINDSTDFTNPLPNVTEWVADSVAPRLEAAGVQFLAWIYNDQNPTKLVADEILKREQSDIIIMVFDNLQTAETWMRSIPYR
jgi:hypothetical protein